MQVLFLVQNPVEANAFYRSTGIAKDLEKRGDFKITIINWQDITMSWSIILQYDVIMFQRPFTDSSLTLCKYIKQCGVKLWVDYDDDLLNVGEENKTFVEYGKKERKECIQKILSIADVVSVSTIQIFNTYKPYCKKISVIENAFNDTLFVREKRKREKLVFWRGSDGHVLNLMAYGKEINKAIENFPDWKFGFMGFFPWMIQQKKTYLGSCDIVLFYHTLQQIAPTLVHSPIVPDAFNSARSPIAFIEGSFAGACCVVPYWWPVEGALKYKDNSEYYENIRSVLRGDVDIEKMNRISWDFIMDVLSLSKVNEKRKKLLENLCK